MSSLQQEEAHMAVVTFTVAQVTALCGGELPYGNGFAWERVERFRLEDGVFQPYAGHTILPGPGIRIETQPVTIS